MWPFAQHQAEVLEATAAKLRLRGASAKESRPHADFLSGFEVFPGRSAPSAMSKVAPFAWGAETTPTRVQVQPPKQEVMKDGMAMTRSDMILRMFGGFDAKGTALTMGEDMAARTRSDATHPSIAQRARPVDFEAAEAGGLRFVVHKPRFCQRLRVPNTVVSVYDQNGVALGHLAEQDMGDFVCCDDTKDIAVMKVLDGKGKQVFALRRKSSCRDMFHVCGYLELGGCSLCKPCDSRPPMVLLCPCTIFPELLSSSCACCCIAAGIPSDCCRPRTKGNEKCQSPCPKCEEQCGTWYEDLCCCAQTRAAEDLQVREARGHVLQKLPLRLA